jgi:hypothetical protein
MDVTLSPVSLPGLTRQSIFLFKKLDHRVTALARRPGDDKVRSCPG